MVLQAFKLEILKLRENILKAIEKNDINTVKKNLEIIDINTIVEKDTGSTPYHKVFYEIQDADKLLPYLKLFHQNGLDINKKDAEGKPEPFPALPPIALFSIIGYFITLLF